MWIGVTYVFLHDTFWNVSCYTSTVCIAYPYYNLGQLDHTTLYFCFICVQFYRFLIIKIIHSKHYSSESALFNIQNNLLLNMAKGSVTALTLLDLSFAFDTIYDTILLDRFNTHYVISDLGLGWYKSCLSCRKGQTRSR